MFGFAGVFVFAACSAAGVTSPQDPAPSAPSAAPPSPDLTKPANGDAASGESVDGSGIDSGGMDGGAVDGSVLDGGNDAACLRQGFVNANAPIPDYTPFRPTINSTCTGTDHQDVKGITKVVFLGDSITVGTPPTLPTQSYASLLTAKLKGVFGANVEFASCAKFGARSVDFLGGGKQFAQCFPSGVESKKTLIVLTVGGNDIGQWAKDGLSAAEATAKADTSVTRLREGILWLKDPAHFPNGSYVAFGNPYEYTDGTGRVTSCLAAVASGFTRDWPQGAPVVSHFLEGYMKVAVETRTDVMFLFEQFCGHGYVSDSPAAPCYRGPNTQVLFDVTCYHPNNAGHVKIADAFFDVITK
jgi:lysophospholipase L1-like esterase